MRDATSLSLLSFRLRSPIMKFRFGPTMAPLAAITLLLSPGAKAQQTATELIDSTDVAYPIVITPTRLKQSLGDVPASVTVITADTIKRYGITRIEEALRLVPGMAVTKATGNDYKINYHGTDTINPRRLNVLIDGVSAYHPGLSRVEWTILPVALEDIDRIEVTRGPDSASYGPNSMMAVVNILTKHPKDVERALVSVQAGSHNTVGMTTRLATRLGNSDVYATYDNQRDSGYDTIIRSRGDAHDSTRVQRLNLRSETDLHAGSSLELQAALVNAKRDTGYILDAYATSYADIKDMEAQFSARLTKSISSNHEIQVKAFHDKFSLKQPWQTCLPQATLAPGLIPLYKANPSLFVDTIRLLLSGDTSNATPQELALASEILTVLAPLGGGLAALRTSCGNTQQDIAESRTQLEVQDTYVFSDALRMVGGFGLRYQSADSSTYFNGEVGNTVRWLFGHVEYRPSSALTFNLGGYGESNSIGRDTFSPRLAMNYHLSEDQSMRLVYSKGTRTPDLGETRSDWTMTVTDLSPPILGSTTAKFVASVGGNPDLTEERITSVEIGYLLVQRNAGLTFDARVFDDRLTQLITDYDLTETFRPTNNGSVRLTGAESQVTWEFAPRWSTWLNFAYLLNRHPSTYVESLQYSRHSGAIGLSHGFNDRWRASLAGYFSSGDGYAERPYARSDLTLSYMPIWLGQDASTSLVVSYLHTPTVNNYLESNTFHASYNDRLSLHGIVRVGF